MIKNGIKTLELFHLSLNLNFRHILEYEKTQTRKQQKYVEKLKERFQRKKKKQWKNIHFVQNNSSENIEISILFLVQITWEYAFIHRRHVLNIYIFYEDEENDLFFFKFKNVMAKLITDKSKFLAKKKTEINKNKNKNSLKNISKKN